MFEPDDNTKWRARDPETGVEMQIVNTPEIDTLSMKISFSDNTKIIASVRLESKYPDKPFKSNDPTNPMIKLIIGSFIRVIDARPGSYDENSKLVRYMLSGLSVINKKWPLCRNPFFYSDLDLYRDREKIIPFYFPRNDEIARL